MARFRLSAALAAPLLALSALPLRADPPVAPDGGGLIEQGALLLFRHMLEQMGPEMPGEMRDRMQGLDLGRMAGLAQLLGDWTQYRMPEVLPNGDILIRRRPDAPPLPPVRPGEPEVGEGGEVEL